MNNVRHTTTPQPKEDNKTVFPHWRMKIIEVAIRSKFYMYVNVRISAWQLTLPESSFYEIDEAVDFEVHVLVQREELYALEHSEYIQFANVHRHNILQCER